MYFLTLGQTSSSWTSANYEGENYGIRNPTESDIRDVIEAIARNEQDLAILSNLDDEGTYIQTAGGAKGALMLEHQEGSLDAYYAASDANLGADRIIGAFVAFLNGDSSWKSQFTWKKVRL